MHFPGRKEAGIKSRVNEFMTAEGGKGKIRELKQSSCHTEKHLTTFHYLLMIPWNRIALQCPTVRHLFQISNCY